MFSFIVGKSKLRNLNRFKRSESGAVTVDFVVLTAAAVLIGAAATTALTQELTSATDQIVIIPD